MLFAPFLDVAAAPEWACCDATQRSGEVWTLHVAGDGTPSDS